MKIRIRYADGVFRGCFLDLRKYSGIHSRTWWGRPQPGCLEYLLDISHADEAAYPGCFVLVRLAHHQDLSGPEGDAFDANSHAIVLSPAGVLLWFESQAMEPPPEVVQMARAYRGDFPGMFDSDPPPSKPFTRAQQEIWDALAAGPADAVALSKKILGRNSPDAIRKRIQDMRRDGRKIGHDRRGYFRLDMVSGVESAPDVSP